MAVVPGEDLRSQISNKEMVNGARLGSLIINEGTRILRRVIESKLRSPLHIELAKHKATLVHLHQSKVINAKQYDLLYPKSGKIPSLDDYDTTLLFVLVRNICGFQHANWKGWNKPTQGNHSTVADLVRLRLFRNELYGHVISTELSDTDFELQWQQVSVVLLRLGSTQSDIDKHKTIFQDSVTHISVLVQFITICREDYDLQKKGLQKSDDILQILDDIKQSIKENAKQQAASLEKHEQSSTELLNEFKQLRETMTSATCPVLALASDTTGVDTEEEPSRIRVCNNSTQTEVADSNVNYCSDELRQHYIATTDNMQPIPWSDFSVGLRDIYTNLELKGKCRPIQFSDLFGIIKCEVEAGETSNAKKIQTTYRLHQRILIEGDPGIGKSTLCLRIVSDWAKKDTNHPLNDFHLVLLLEARYLFGEFDQIRNIIAAQLLADDSKVDRVKLWQWIEDNPQCVLLVIDGWDELPNNIKDELGRSPHLQENPHDLTKIIQNKILRNCCCLITTRPEIHLPRYCDFQLVNKGFTPDHSKEFIKRYFILPEMCAEPHDYIRLIEHIERENILLQLARNPLNTLFLCMIWEDKHNAMPTTRTALYEEFEECIIRRFCAKNKDDAEFINCIDTAISDLCSRFLSHLGKIAYCGILEEQYYFDEQILRQHCSDERLLKTGFLIKEKGTSKIRPITRYAYSHLSIQEHFAGNHLYAYSRKPVASK
ncbi:uncharacterized protein LOC144447219 [Glandiceps talaboti]